MVGSQLDSPPTALEFLREFVMQNRPVIFRNLAKDWPAIINWDLDYLKEKVGKKIVQIAVVPDGLADAIVDGKFQLPEERKMRFSDFIDILRSQKHAEDDGIYYLQRQNNCLIEGTGCNFFSFLVVMPRGGCNIIKLRLIIILEQVRSKFSQNISDNCQRNSNCYSYKV